MNNIFIHDAVPTWSGFLYQGQIAVYLAVKKIYELETFGKKDEAGYYSIEMEKCEDIAVIYETKDYKQYQSIHQVKNYKKNGIKEYKNPLIQLMLEKGFCQKNGYGVTDAYLHVSRSIVINDKTTFEDKIIEWKREINQFYENLCELKNKLNINDDIYEVLKKLKECVEGEPIELNRQKYKNITIEIKNECKKNMKAYEECENMDIHKVKEGVIGLIDFLKEELCVSEINNDVKIYRYGNNKNYCTGTDIFKHIVDYIVKYKSTKGIFCKEQYEYIADKMLSFVERNILKRHQLMQEGKNASSRIFLSEFWEILDEGIEQYEEEANVLALIRKYDERIDEYCSICQNQGECFLNNCKLQKFDVRRNRIAKNKFIKLCYNLNPECVNTIEDRACLSELLKEDGMLDSVFASIKAIPDTYFAHNEDMSRFEVRNNEKTAFLTAISNRHGNLIVEKIEKALSINQKLIENIFDADQLVTVQLEESAEIWDSSCIEIRKEDLPKDENGEKDEDHSIYVAKKPEFIKADCLIKEIGIK